MNAEEAAGNPRSTSNSRVKLVFISRTFRDMMGEQDVPVVAVFPELRERGGAEA